jgi:methylglyoxal synthase
MNETELPALSEMDDMPDMPEASPPRALNIGLASNRAHQEGEQCALFQLIRATEPLIRQLEPRLCVVGRTCDALFDAGLLAEYHNLAPYPYGRAGGLMRLVSRVVDDDPAKALDLVIYLIDPVDPSSVFPEAMALKRQCVVHGKPFISTLAGALEWFDLLGVAAGAAASSALDESFEFGRETIALVAHDAKKSEMLDFARAHFDFFDRFGCRIATGTTGTLLNELARELRPEVVEPWVQPLKSGPLGGDAQIAEWLLDRRCRRVIFFEDPHVARQHEADIQLLERAARVVTDFAICMNDPATATTWVAMCEQRLALGQANEAAA